MDRAGRTVVRALLRAFVVVAVLALGIASGAVAPAPAAADSPTVVVTPDHVRDGQRVGVDISGFEPGFGSLLECAASATVNPTFYTLDAGCQMLAGPYVGGPPPAHEDVTVESSFLVFNASRTVVCATEPGGCVVGVIVGDIPEPGQPFASAFAPITFLPALHATPQRNLTDGTTVHVTGTEVASGTWTVAQCGRDHLDAPSPTSAAALCTTPTPVTVTAAGFAVDLVAHDPLTAAGGGAVPCGPTGCALVLAGASGGDPVAASLGISFGPTRVAVDPATGVPDGATVDVALTGAADGVDVVTFSQCLLPSAATQPATRCAGTSPTHVDEWGSASLDLEARAAIVVENGQPPVDCRTHPGGCGFVVFDGAGRRLGEAPIDFAPPPAVTLSPSSGLLDGQAMTLAADNLVPGGSYLVQHCLAFACDTGQTVSAAAGGTLSLPVPALQRFTAGGRSVVCRSACSVRVLKAGGGAEIGRRPYAMAAGSLTVTPDTGLTDGQQVQVTGSDLMVGYGGPPIFGFPTGGWTLTQCDRALLGQLNLGGALTHCSTAPPTLAVGVTSPSYTATLEAPATITKILGGTTDCAASAGACVVGLVRFEQDGSFSAHLVPVSFGSSG